MCVDRKQKTSQQDQCGASSLITNKLILFHVVRDGRAQFPPFGLCLPTTRHAPATVALQIHQQATASSFSVKLQQQQLDLVDFSSSILFSMSTAQLAYQQLTHKHHHKFRSSNQIRRQAKSSFSLISLFFLFSIEQPNRTSSNPATGRQASAAAA